MNAITPKEAQEAYKNIPDEVINQVNKLLSANASNDKITFSKSTLSSNVANCVRLYEVFRNSNCDTKTTMENLGWFNFKPLYEESGWNVELKGNTFIFTPKIEK